MHGVLITFVSDVPVGQLSGPFAAFADGLQSVDGFVSKAWLHDGSTVGGFYVFVDEPSANAYLVSPMVADLQANEHFSDFVVRQFSILDDLSARTGLIAPTTTS